MMGVEATQEILSKIKKITCESLIEEYGKYKAKKSDECFRKETKQLGDLDNLLTNIDVRTVIGTDVKTDELRRHLSVNLSLLVTMYYGTSCLWAIDKSLQVKENSRDYAKYDQMLFALEEINRIVNIIIGDGMHGYVIRRLYQFNKNEQGYINLLEKIGQIFIQDANTIE